MTVPLPSSVQYRDRVLVCCPFVVVVQGWVRWTWGLRCSTRRTEVPVAGPRGGGRTGMVRGVVWSGEGPRRGRGGTRSGRNGLLLPRPTSSPLSPLVKPAPPHLCDPNREGVPCGGAAPLSPRPPVLRSDPANSVVFQDGTRTTPRASHHPSESHRDGLPGRPGRGQETTSRRPR